MKRRAARALRRVAAGAVAALLLGVIAACTHADGPHDFSARGNHGQFAFVSPAHGVVIARNGRRYGVPPGEWMTLLEAMAEGLGAPAP